MFHLSPPPGFRGLNPDLPVTMTRRHLPHWRQDGATYFVTFRTADSIPASRLNDLKILKRELDNASDSNQEQLQQAWRKLARFTNQLLDESHGDCPLNDRSLAEIVVSALRHFDGDRYFLSAYTVMPNHVHLLVRPSDGHTLETTLKSWKQHTATQLNAARKTKGKFWQAESYDRIVRDEEELYRIVQYIGNNGTKAGLGDGEYQRWICPLWQEAGWGFEP